ncbi:MAG TPA: hypothetical protein VEH77_06230, partial [Roseiarcus sp.]|nr:hypothetical protein [Roseiarcus sp.]
MCPRWRTQLNFAGGSTAPHAAHADFSRGRVGRGRLWLPEPNGRPSLLRAPRDNFRLAESSAIGYGSGPMARYVFITGGVVSSLGKGLA